MVVLPPVCRLCADLLAAMDCSRLTVGLMKVRGLGRFKILFVRRLWAKSRFVWRETSGENCLSRVRLSTSMLPRQGVSQYELFLLLARVSPRTTANAPHRRGANTYHACSC